MYVVLLKCGVFVRVRGIWRLRSRYKLHIISIFSFVSQKRPRLHNPVTYLNARMLEKSHTTFPFKPKIRNFCLIQYFCLVRNIKSNLSLNSRFIFFCKKNPDFQFEINISVLNRVKKTTKTI